MSSYKLYYFDGFGLAEQIRLLLKHAKIDFEDIRYSQEEFKKAKEEHPERFEFGQVPVLEIDGQFFSQSTAIVRSLGSQHGLYSTDPLTMHQIDSSIDALKDLVQQMVTAFRTTDEEAKAKALDNYFANVLPVFVERIENRLKNNSSQKRLVGDNLTIADIVFAGIVTSRYFNDQNTLHSREKEVIEKFPIYQAYITGLQEDFKEHFETRKSCPF